MIVFSVNKFQSTKVTKMSVVYLVEVEYNCDKLTDLLFVLWSMKFLFFEGVASHVLKKSLRFSDYK